MSFIVESIVKRLKAFGGFLVAASAKEKTFERYSKEVSFFVTYIVNRGLDFASVEDLDMILQEYMEEVYVLNLGRGKSLVANVLNGVKLFVPRARGKLLISEKSYKGFGTVSPSVAYPPMSRGLVYLVAYWFCSYVGLDSEKLSISEKLMGYGTF